MLTGPISGLVLGTSIAMRSECDGNVILRSVPIHSTPFFGSYILSTHLLQYSLSLEVGDVERPLLAEQILILIDLTSSMPLQLLLSTVNKGKLL